MSNKLTPKQEKFCQEMRKLGNQYQAYCNAFNTRKMSRNAIDVEASKLMNNPKITLRIKELAEELKKEYKRVIRKFNTLAQQYTRIKSLTDNAVEQYEDMAIKHHTVKLEYEKLRQENNLQK